MLELDARTRLCVPSADEVVGVTERQGRSRSPSETASFERPYAPGWFDRLTAWVDQLPGPNALYYLALMVLQLAYVTTLLWFNGKLPVGSIDLRVAFAVVIAPYLLWVRFYLDRIAAAAMDSFRSVLAVSDSEFLRLRYELTTLPARTTCIATWVAIVAFLLNALLLPDSIIQQFGTSLESALIVMGPIGLLAVPIVLVSLLQALHQLQMVERIHSLIGAIALLRAKPLYAFSHLTARTGVSFLLLTYYIAVVRPDFVSSSRATEILLAAMVPTAIACFVLPLRGIHRRLADEKARALAQVTARFEILFARVHERVDQAILADADKLNVQIASLTAERDALMHVSTWPWEPATLTGFISTLIVPAAVWGLQRLLERIGS